MTKYATTNEIKGSAEFHALNPDLRAKPKAVDKTAARKTLEQSIREDFAAQFEAVWKRNGGPELEKEYKFDSGRQWRADYRIGQWLIELDGGVYSNGRHVRPAGYIGDCMKLNAAALQGYRVIRIPTGFATDDYVATIIEIIQ